MAHYAEVDKNNVVVCVLCIDNDWTEKEAQDFLAKLSNNRWVQTSYNDSFRGQYAGRGFTYDKDLDIFISPKPYSSWLLDTKTGRWDPPVSYPEDGKRYEWDESVKGWKDMDARGV